MAVDKNKLNNLDVVLIKASFKKYALGILITSIITIIILILFIFSQNNSWIIKFEFRDVIAVATCGVVVTTLIYHSINYESNLSANQIKIELDREKLNVEIERSKMTLSYQICSEWSRPSMAENVRIMRALTEGKDPKLVEYFELLQNNRIKEFSDKLDSDLEIRSSFISVLNFLETLSVSVDKNIVNEEFIRENFQTLFLKYSKSLKAYIHFRQAKSPRMYRNFEKIAETWNN
jgi:hypothetical protein